MASLLSQLGQLALGDESGEAPAPTQPSLLGVLAGLAVAYVVYRANSNSARERSETIDEWDDEDWDEAPPKKATRPPRRRQLADDVTDSLLDEPAAIADRGREGDCYKAVSLLKKRVGLARTKQQQTLFKRTTLTVAEKCRGESAEIEQAMADDRERAAEAEAEVASASRGSATDAKADKAVASAIETWLELDPRASRGEIERELKSDDDGDNEFDPAAPYDLSRRKRKTKTDTKPARARAGRPSSATFTLKRGKLKYRVRKKPSKTKRGYTLVKEVIHS